MAATDKQEFILYHEESTKTLFLFREEGRYSVRAWMVVEERAGWRYLHEGCRCEPLCTESWLEHLLENLCLERKPITWGYFLLSDCQSPDTGLSHTVSVSRKKDPFLC